MSQQSSKYIIQSKIDGQKFTVARKVIDSSSLLKIFVRANFVGLFWKVIATLFNHYQTINLNEHDTAFEKELYDTYTANKKQSLIQLIQELCILDSDFFLDSVADYILEIIGFEEQMNWNDIQMYLGLEDDFTATERKQIQNNKKLEYFLSINNTIPSGSKVKRSYLLPKKVIYLNHPLGFLNFPFPNKNLYSLKTHFSTPMNALLARIIQRSDEKISYLLSLINRTIKNEVVRHPFKLEKISLSKKFWNFNIHFFQGPNRGFIFYLNCKTVDKSYFDILKKRKVIAKEVEAAYDNYEDGKIPIKIDSLNFIISKKAEISFSGSYTSIYQFNPEECPMQSVQYIFSSLNEWEIEFAEVYNHLIAKDLSKEIEFLMWNHIFKFFWPKVLIRFYKKPNSSKFYLFEVRNHQHIYPKFKQFVINYMEDDGIIKSTAMIQGIPEDVIGVKKLKGYYEYRVSDLKKYLDFIVTK